MVGRLPKCLSDLFELDLILGWSLCGGVMGEDDIMNGISREPTGC